MSGQKTISTTFITQPPYVPPPPTPDYIISGNGNPSPNGNYFDAGSYGGKRYYQKSTADYFLWWESFLLKWTISPTLGGSPISFWERQNADPGGIYNSVGAFSGNPTATEG